MQTSLTLSRGQIAILIGLGAALWLLAAVLIKILSPLGVHEGGWRVLLYALIAPGTYPFVLFTAWVAGLARDQIFTGYAVATMTAMLLDGMALAWLPQLYGSTVEDAANAGAVILWGAGLGLVIAALLNGPADQKVSAGQAATS